MPYYCTVPQCTSMAGKAKNVSFHQFPRDQDLARLWNHILKRGKPYTKYSKVCSLHFRPEDYTITSVGKNKGQWRTLRKDAVPSRNLPSDTAPTPHRRNSGAWLPQAPIDPAAVDPRVQMQMAQAIYMKTMMSMQTMTPGTEAPQPSLPEPSSNHVMLSDALTLLLNHKKETSIFKETNFKCTECSKCFKDPDVFVLHRRTHVSKDEREDKKELTQNSCENMDSVTLTDIEKILQNRTTNENNENEASSRQETLKSNPILANLLRSGIPNSDGTNLLDVNNILSIENQIMTALAASMESYIRNLTSMLAEAKSKENSGNDEQNDNNSENDEQNNHNSENDEPNNHNSENDSDDTQSVCKRLKIETENIKSEQNDETSNDAQNSDQNFDVNRVRNEHNMDCSFDNYEIENINHCEESLGQASSKNNATESTGNDGNSENEELITLNDLGLNKQSSDLSEGRNFENNYLNFLNDGGNSEKSQKKSSKNRNVKNRKESAENEELITFNDLGLQSVQNNQSSDFASKQNLYNDRNFENNYLNFLNDGINSAKSQKNTSKNRNVKKRKPDNANSMQVSENNLSNDKNHKNSVTNDENCIENELSHINYQLDGNLESIPSNDNKCTKNDDNIQKFDDQSIENQNKGPDGPICDNEDLNKSKDSDTLMIDDSV